MLTHPYVYQLLYTTLNREGLLAPDSAFASNVLVFREDV